MRRNYLGCGLHGDYARCILKRVVTILFHPHFHSSLAAVKNQFVIIPLDISRQVSVIGKQNYILLCILRNVLFDTTTTDDVHI